MRMQEAFPSLDNAYTKSNSLMPSQSEISWVESDCAPLIFNSNLRQVTSQIDYILPTIYPDTISETSSLTLSCGLGP